MLNEALEFQIKADSLTSLAAEQRKLLESTTGSANAGIKTRISELESSAAALQKAADQKYNEARLAMSPQPEKSTKQSTAMLYKPPVNIDTVKKPAANTVNVPESTC